MKKISIFLVAALSMQSCATLFTGTTDQITFNSQPEGAKVLHKGIDKCTTPCVLEMPRSMSAETMEMKLDGYQPKLFTLNKEFNAVTLLNIVLGGVIGLGVDAATGAMMQYTDNEYSVDFNTDSVASKKVPKVKPTTEASAQAVAGVPAQK